MNKELLKKLNFKPVYVLLKNYSQNSQLQSLEEFFKFYSDSVKHEDRFKPLCDNDYGRFISSRAAKREPALTRQISKYLLLNY